MTDFANRGALGLKKPNPSKPRKGMSSKGDDRTPEEKAYHDWQRSQPCIVCQLFGEQQLSPTTVHHWIMGRGSNRRTPHLETLPICDGHHQGTFDKSKISVHREPVAFKKKYGTDKQLSEDYREMRKHINDAWGIS